MQMLLEFLPLAAFVVAYYLFGKDIYVATATLMAAMVLSLAVLWVRARRLPPMFAMSTLLVLAFGALTLWLRNAHFIQWKPSILMWLAAVAFLVSAFIGDRPLAQRMMEPTLGEQVQLDRGEWRTLNAAWVLYGLLVGAINVVLIYSVSESTWVNIKIPLLMGTMVLFIAGQFFWLYRRGKFKP